MKRLLIILLLSLVFTGCAASNKDPLTTESAESTQDSTTHTEIQNTEPASQNTESLAEFISITVYVPNENADGFNTVIVEGERLTFLDAMIEVGVLTEDIEINSFTWTKDTVKVDFNAAFKDLINTMGTSGEYVLMGSIVNTLIEMNDVEYVEITVDGEILESGHVIYDFPMDFYE